MSDPVAAKSGFLKMYMSHHPDTLVAYCKFYGKVTEPIANAEMSAINCKSMTLTYTTRKGERQSVVIPIQPPLSGYEDVKPRLLEMKAKAQEGLGMIQAPKITSFRLPKDIIQTGLAISLLVYCTFAIQPNPPSIPIDRFWEPGRALIRAVGGPSRVTWAWGTVCVLHGLEALYTMSLCRRHSTGFVVGALYTVTTFLFGYPGWIDLRRRIQAARIDSVMKIE